MPNNKVSNFDNWEKLSTEQWNNLSKDIHETGIRTVDTVYGFKNYRISSTKIVVEVEELDDDNNVLQKYKLSFEEGKDKKSIARKLCPKSCVKKIK